MQKKRRKNSVMLLKEHTGAKVIVYLVFGEKSLPRPTRLEGTLENFEWKRNVTVSGSVFPFIGWKVGIARIVSKSGRRPVLYANHFKFGKTENDTETITDINRLRKRRFGKNGELPAYLLKLMKIKDSGNYSIKKAA